MLFRFFSRGGSLAYLAILAVLVLLRLRLLLHPEFYVIGDQTLCHAPLWDTVFWHVAPASGVASALALVATALCALLVNNIADRFGLAPQQGAVAGLAFVLLAGGLRHSIAFQPATVFALFLVWGLDRLFSAMRKDYPYASVAWGFAVCAVGSLFWAKGVWFIPFLVVMLFVMRLSSLRCLAAALVGSLSVAFVACAVALFMPDPLESGRAFLRAAADTTALWKIGAFSTTYIVAILAALVLAALAIQKHLSEMNIQESRRIRVAEWVLFFSVFLMTLPGFSFELQVVAAVGASLFVPAFVSRLKSPKASSAYLVFIAAFTAWMIYV